MQTDTLCHVLGAVALLTDVVALWLLGSKVSALKRRLGVFGMAGVNLLFAVQAVLMLNYTLLIVSGYSAVMQVRAGVNWRKTPIA